jgi:hypothetical protein
MANSNKNGRYTPAIPEAAKAAITPSKTITSPYWSSFFFFIFSLSRPHYENKWYY